MPDGRALSVVTTPNPEGGVTYLFDDVTESLDLARRFDGLIRVQRETLDSLAEGVAVFGSNGKAQLFNPAFVRMWKLSSDAMGLSPQLTLEAAILREGGFPEIDAGSSVSQLVYVRLSGNNPPGEERILELKYKPGDEPQPPDTAAAEARAKLEALIRAFEDENQPYTSLNLPMWTNRYGAYDDLARIKEWSAAGGLGIEEW